MSYAVISDVHSNLHALTAAFDDIKKRNVDEVFFIGDAVGYGPQPDKCIDLLKKNCKVLLAGNHDWAVIGYTDVEYFNEYAMKAVIWTQNVITEEHFNDLESFSIVKSVKELDTFLVHSTPKDPEKWSYLFTLDDAKANFNYFKQRLCFIGHSHRPVIIEMNKSGELLIFEGGATLNDNSRYIINTGSVGQPRDNDPRLSYVLVSDESIQVVRVEYDIKKTQDEMLKCGLPDRLIQRLSFGV